MLTILTLFILPSFWASDVSLADTSADAVVHLTVKDLYSLDVESQLDDPIIHYLDKCKSGSHHDQATQQSCYHRMGSIDVSVMTINDYRLKACYEAYSSVGNTRFSGDPLMVTYKGHKISLPSCGRGQFKRLNKIFSEQGTLKEEHRSMDLVVDLSELGRRTYKEALTFSVRFMIGS